jgi:hypothetical protein
MYLVPAEKAHEDARAELISFHEYECKVLLCQDGKEHCRLELVWKRLQFASFIAFFICRCLDAATTTWQATGWQCNGWGMAYHHGRQCKLTLQLWQEDGDIVQQGDSEWVLLEYLGQC